MADINDLNPRLITHITFENPGTTNYTEHVPTEVGFNDDTDIYWRIITTKDSLTQNQLLDMVKITNDKYLRLTSTKIDNSVISPKINFANLKNQYAWEMYLGFNEYGYNIEMEFKTPYNDALLFNFPHSSFLTDSNFSSGYFCLCILNLIYKSGKFYLYIDECDYDTRNYIIISQISNSNETPGTTHKFNFDYKKPYQKNSIGQIIIKFDDVKIVEIQSINKVSGPGFEERYNYKLLERTELNTNSLGKVISNSSTNFRDIFSFGYGSSSLRYQSFYSTESYNIINTFDGVTTTGNLNNIKYVKNPVSSTFNPLDLFIDPNEGDYIEIKYIKIFGYYLEQKENYKIDILNPITVSIPIPKNFDILNPISLTVENDYLKTLKQVEDYINKMYLGDQRSADDFQLLMKVTDTSYWPVEFSIDEVYHIHIKPDPIYLKVPLYACTNKQFLYQQYKLT